MWEFGWIHMTFRGAQFEAKPPAFGFYACSEKKTFVDICLIQPTDNIGTVDC